LQHAKVNVAISITGIAGPTGGSTEKPVGTVCFGWAIQNAAGENVASCQTKRFTGDRQTVRQQASDYALTELLKLLSKQ